MDRLTTTLFAVLFIFGGSGLTSAGLLALMFGGVIDVTYLTLSAVSVMLTYYICGLSGLFVVSFSSVALVAAGSMYWYEMSFQDVKKMLTDMNEQGNQEAIKKSKDSNAKQDEGSGETINFSQKMRGVNKYKDDSLKAFYEKTGLTEDKIKTYKGYYALASTKFNVFCEALYAYIVQFRAATEEVPGLREIYRASDGLVKVKTNVEMVRGLHKMSRSMSGMSGMPGMATPASQPTQRSESNPPDLGGLGDLGSMFGGMDLGNIMSMNQQMQQQMSQLDPAQKKQMDEMTKQLMGNMNMGDMMSMFGGGAPSKNKTRRRKK